MHNRLLLYLVVIFSLILSGCFIKGRVVDQNGNGMAGVTVELSGDASGFDITDRNGYYQFGSFSNKLSAGNYIITSLGHTLPNSRDVTITTQGSGDIPMPVSGVDFVFADAKISPRDRAHGDCFGSSVSISGNYAIIGAGGDDDNGEDSGSAYIYQQSDGSWIQMDKIIAGDGDTYDYFGSSVSISGDYAIVGVPYDEDNGFDSGSAYIFQRSGSSWIQMVKIIAGDGDALDYFGESVSISGDYAIVGAPHEDGNETGSGSAHIYQRSGSSWVQMEKLIATDGASGDSFGRSISISGDYVIVGAPRDDDNGTDSGSAYIFQRSGTSWVQMDKLIAGDGASGDSFGQSVSISGDYVIVGEPYDDDNGTASGSAYIFQRSGSSWIQMDKLIAGDAYTSDKFGRSVSISGDYAIVGVSEDDDNGTDSGSAYIFQRSGSSWIQTDKLSAYDGDAHDWFGHSVSISGDYAITGAPQKDYGTFYGAAYIYYLN